MKEFPERRIPRVYQKKEETPPGLKETEWHNLSLAEWKELSNHFLLLFGVLPMTIVSAMQAAPEAVRAFQDSLKRSVEGSAKVPETDFAVQIKEEDNGKTIVRILLPDNTEFITRWPRSDFSFGPNPGDARSWRDNTVVIPVPKKSGTKEGPTQDRIEPSNPLRSAEKPTEL